MRKWINMDLCPAHISYTRNMTECLQMLLWCLWSLKLFVLMGKKAADQPWGRAQQKMTEASMVDGVAGWAETASSSRHRALKRLWYIYAGFSSRLSPSVCMIHKCITMQIDCLISHGILLNFHVVCAILLQHWGHFIILLPAAELVLCKNKRSEGTHFIIKYTHSTANTRLNMVIWIYCWDESKENTTCKL